MFNESEISFLVERVLTQAFSNFGNMLAPMLLAKIWDFASEEQKQTITNAFVQRFIEGLTGSKWDIVRAILTPERIQTATSTPAATEQLDAAIVARAGKEIDELRLDRYDSAEQSLAFRVVLSKLLESVVGDVLSKKLPDIEQQVADMLSKNVLDEGVRRHTEAIFRQLRASTEKVG